MPASRPRIVLGDGLVPDRAAEDRRDHVGGAGQHEEDAATSQIVGIRPAQRDDSAVRRRGDHDRPAVVVHPRGPARSARSPAARRRSRRSRAGRAARGVLEDLLGQRGEQHHRERQQHRGDVDEVGAEQVAAPDARSAALADARPGWAAWSRRGAGSGRIATYSSVARRTSPPTSTTKHQPMPT